MNIRTAVMADAPQMAGIYNYYIRETIISFETDQIDETEAGKRIQDKTGKYNWLVLEDSGLIAGYAYYGKFRDRAAYDHVVESSIYLDHTMTGKGYGPLLYQALITDCRQKGFKEMVGVIALPNPQSVRLHEKLGFMGKGVLPNMGYKFNRYIDIGFWQKSL